MENMEGTKRVGKIYKLYSNQRLLHPTPFGTINGTS